MRYIAAEPVRFWASITALVEAVLALLVVFSIVSWNEVQIATIMGVVAAAGGIFQSFFVRAQVTPVG